jgi:hypothetical protein
MTTAVVAAPLDIFIGPMLGLPAWGIQQGHGSFLTFEFGEPRLDVREGRSAYGGLRRDAFVHGQWHIRIYCCHWRALRNGVELAWSEDSAASIRRATATLNGQKLIGVRVAPEEGRSNFTFDLGGTLETWPYGDDPTEEQWTIYSGSESFKYRADGLYLRGPIDTPLDVESWLPLH